ncbi:SURP and G-patch domain-containing protein 1 isoform X2 [Strongylocentrotus purpuratus]|uniref:SURP and G-patch domain-containing protein 1 n=1 Tax=Strongylocentrotus purpuratus TaxID=7668 RepID=A0A7M7N8E6_STRPU|nr:SURP and G-patch domain-containing protein 1 isoform X2 [Strongylocentrotus purpuratus]
MAFSFKHGADKGPIKPSFQDKMKSLSDQERMLLQKRQEIERKMAQKKKEAAAAAAAQAAAAGAKPKTSPGGATSALARFNQSRKTPVASTSSAAQAKPPPAAPSPVQNTFSNDGSFMAHFMKMQQEQQRKKAAESSAALAQQPPPPPRDFTHAMLLQEAQQGFSPSLGMQMRHFAEEKAAEIEKIPLPPPPEVVPFPPSKARSPTSPVPLNRPSTSAVRAKIREQRERQIANVFGNSSDSEEEDEGHGSAGKGVDSSSNAGLVSPPEDVDLKDLVDRIARQVAEGGDAVEAVLLSTYRDIPKYRFMHDKSSPAHGYYKTKLAVFRLAAKASISYAPPAPSAPPAAPMSAAAAAAAAAAASISQQLGYVPPSFSSGAEAPPVKKKRSRWGETAAAEEAPPVKQMALLKPVNPVGMIGTTELSDDQQRQLMEQQEMQMLYEMVIKTQKREAELMMEKKGKDPNRKYEYDSDEDIDGGTWEHKARAKEMEDTRKKAELLTGMNRGKHFIGDFLPPEELEKFMETLHALQEGRTPDYSEYKEFKIQADNIGFQMLQKLGWSEGEGLGPEKQGITAPVRRGDRVVDGVGFGVERPEKLSRDDASDEYTAFRKRMMLAYRFRPNPLNNPRRPYY